jgi:hypothetical protein
VTVKHLYQYVLLPLEIVTASMSKSVNFHNLNFCGHLTVLHSEQGLKAG